MMNTLELATREVNRGWLWLKREILARRFVRDVGALTAANAVSAVLIFLQWILVARWLGPELYGVAALVMSFPSLVYMLFDARSTDSAVKYLSQFHVRHERERAVAICQLGYGLEVTIATLALVIVFFTAPWAAQHVVHRPETAWLILLYAAAFIPKAFTRTSYAVLAVLGRFSVSAGIEVVTTVIRVSVVLGLVLGGYGVAGVILGNSVALVLSGVFYSVVAFRLVHVTWGIPWWRGRWTHLKDYGREIFQFLGFSELNAFLGMIPKQLDVVILGYFRGPTEAGYYRLARSLASVVGYLVGPLQSVTYAELARLWGLGNREAMGQRVRQLALHVGAPMGLIALGSILLVPFVLPILVGPSYLPAVRAAQLLLAGTGIWLGFFWLRPLYFAKADLRTWTRGIGAYAIMFIIVSIPASRAWGYQGMALSLAVVTIAFHLVMVSMYRAQEAKHPG